MRLITALVMIIKFKDKLRVAGTKQRVLASLLIPVFLLSACTNDYITLEPIGTQVNPTVEIQPTIDLAFVTTPVAPVIEETIIAVEPTLAPTPTVLAEAGIGGGSMDTTDTLEIGNSADSIQEISEDNTPGIFVPSASGYSSTGIKPTFIYRTQAGDTIPALAARFGVNAEEIVLSSPVSSTGFLDPNLLLNIPRNDEMETTASLMLLPDSEIVFSPSGLDFDVTSFVENAGGYLSGYREYLNSAGWLDGAGVIEKVAIENSMNPRVLLSILEYYSNWVYGQPVNEQAKTYPLGHIDESKKGLYSQLTWAVGQLSQSYYGWREGILTDIPLKDGTTIHGAPELNAGTFAIQYLFALLFDRATWEAAVYNQAGFAAFHEQIFGNPWIRATTVEPLFPATLTQPEFILPFEKNVEWSFSGGPHAAWGASGARAALDFAPSSAFSGCTASNAWVVSIASGIVTRSGGGVIALDLDGDGNEQTGWAILYMHVGNTDRVKIGDFLEQGQRIGHPSCEGGVATGTHVHIARKFNGEWILAGGPLPFVMDQWEAHAAAQAYKGTLIRDNQVVTACTCGTRDTVIVRKDDSPISNVSSVE